MTAVPWQDATGAAPASFWQWLAGLGTAPGVVEGLVAAAVVGGCLLAWWRLAGLVRDAQSRQALGDYLLGVEQALHGDLDGAHRRLQSVVQHDPQNHYARLLLGKVLAERGEPEQAHQQHLCLKSAFGIDSAANDRMLAQSLLGAGFGQQAAEAAQRALAKEPNHAAGHEFVYRARLQGGDFPGAVEAGRRWFQSLPATMRTAAVKADLAATLVAAGRTAHAHGDHELALKLLQEARRHDPSAEGGPLLAARLDAVRHGVGTAVHALLQDSGPSAATARQAVPATTRSGALATASSRTGLPIASWQGLVAAERFRCRACTFPLARELAECPRCGARGPSEALEPALTGELAAPMATMDAIDCNDAHVQRRVQDWTQGDDPTRAAARRDLLAIGDAAVPELLRAAWQKSEPARTACIELLQAMGPAIAPALFAASHTLTKDRLLPIGSPAAVVGRVVQGFDRSALPHIEPLFASAKAEDRKILIDFFVGLADLEQFQLVLERFPPLEILNRLNKADAAVLQRFLRAVPPGHFVAETLLRESTFYRDEDVLAAIPGAPNADVLLGVLRARGADSAATEMLLAAIADPALADVAERVLGELGPGALEHVLAAFADPERPEAERARLRSVLERGGPAAATLLANGFGPEPAAADDELRAVLVHLGELAVGPLQAAYERSGWLEKVAIGLLSRHTNRRVQIVATLRAIGSATAQRALRELLDGERDGNLRLRLQQALHGGGDAPAR